ncbi:MAG TPA: DUF4440 domain-containing protein [Gammaproteobacteria bacterium]|nr:DUF4440 domain-containing protein [Gammaproteobacteria bacterium]
MNVTRRLSQLLMTACCLLALTACATDGTQPDSRATADAQEDIGQLHAAFTKAFNAKDSAGMAATYTDDAILMPPNQPEVKTDIGIETFARQMFSSSPVTGLLLNPNETQVLGSGWAYSSGFYSMLGANGSILDRGKFLEVLKQTDKGWKIHRDIFNSDLAPPSSTPAAGTTMAPAAATH